MTGDRTAFSLVRRSQVRTRNRKLGASFSAERSADPEDMITWLRFPRQVVPENNMPDIGLTEVQAQQIAARRYTLGL